MPTHGLDGTEYRRVSRDAARRAAQAAAKAQAARSAPFGTFGRVALYTWGTLAAGSLMLASVALFVPSLDAAKTPSARVAEAPVTPPPTKPPTPTPDELAFPDLPKPSQPTEIARNGAIELDPVATGGLQGTVRTANFGTEIARSTSIPALVERYTSLDDRAPDIFAGLEPLIRLDEKSELLEAALIAGPFENSGDADLFCRTIRLQLMVRCRRAAYEGDAFLPR